MDVQGTSPLNVLEKERNGHTARMPTNYYFPAQNMFTTHPEFPPLTYQTFSKRNKCFQLHKFMDV